MEAEIDDNVGMIADVKNRNELSREWIVVVIDGDPSVVVSIGVDAGRMVSGAVVSSVVRTTGIRAARVKSIVAASLDVTSALGVVGDRVLTSDVVTFAAVVKGVIGTGVPDSNVVARAVEVEGVVACAASIG